ncbi:ATP-binding protein [Corallococcus sp. AB030]|nr:ATP-binding protein [Corallococcus sp. AB030]
MYVARPDLEARLRQSLTGTQHVIVHGESGTGKSWLYKKVLADMQAVVLPINLANASRFGGIAAEMKNALERLGTATQTGYSETKSSEMTAVLATGGLEHEKTFALGTKEPFEACCAHLRKEAGKHPACIVFDNLETIFESDEMMNELANLIVLLDDERYSEYRIKMLIVGVPTGVRDYFNRTRNRATVANRLQEIPEVSRLSQSQTAELVKKGFVQELAYDVQSDVLSRVTEHVAWVSDRIPQRIHEYCLEIAQLAQERDKLVGVDLLEVADAHWLSRSLSNTYSVIENLMNERDTKIGRRNQVLFCLGRVEGDEIRLSEIEALVRTEFSRTTENKTLDISTLLSRLAQGDDGVAPVLRRSPKGDTYQFADPMFRMCIRAMLIKDSERQVVSKRSISTIAAGGAV